MAMSKSNRFTWKKPVVKPAKPIKGAIEHRLKNHSEVKAATSTVREEFDAITKKRRGDKNG